MGVTWDADLGRWRDEETGSFVSSNEALRADRVTMDEHGVRAPDGRFIPRDAVEQKGPEAGAFEAAPSAERLVIQDEGGRLQLIRAGGHGTDTSTPEEVTDAGLVSEGLKRGFLTEGEYEDLGKEDAADLLRDMALVVQDVTRFGA